MKTPFALLALGLLVAPAALASPFHDQLKNGSFESGSTGVNGLGVSTYVPDHWAVEVGTVQASALATDGNVSAQLRALPNELGGHFSVLAQTIPETSTDAPIVPGAWYDLSFEAQGLYHGGKGHGNATVTWTGALGHTLRVDTVVVPEGAGFRTYTAHLQAPIDPIAGDAATSATVRFLVDGQSSDTDVNLWVDNAHFGPGSPA